MPTTFDMFCGCGGISSGLRSAGFRVLAGADIEANYICTFKRNFPEAAALTQDLSEIQPEEVMASLGLTRGGLDLLSGGPPCQGFSKNVPRRSRFLDLPNNQLVRTFIRYVEAFQPRAVLMENVAEMKNGFGSAYTDEILKRFHEAGYSVAYEVLNAADYGVPQRRRRAFFVALRGQQYFTFPSTSHTSRRKDGKEERQLDLMPTSPDGHLTVWDAIGDLPSVAHDDPSDIHHYVSDPSNEFQQRMRRNQDQVLNHRPRPLASKQLERLRSIRPGEGLKHLPEHLRPKSGYSGAYGRLTKDMVAPTITRWVFHPGSGRFGHPHDYRVITIREAARIQSFPDDFEFVGTYTQQAGQIGNAVPPLLAEVVGRALIRHLSGRGVDSSH